MFKNVTKVIDINGENFSVTRNSNIVGEFKGVATTENSSNRKIVMFYPGADVKAGDWIKGKVSGNKFYIIEISNQAIKDEIILLRAYTQTKLEIENSKKQTENVSFNIQNANGSIIGTQSNANITNSYNLDELQTSINKEDQPDKEQINELINMLKAITENNVPIQKGTLSKFEDLLAKHEWLTGALAQSLFGWLAGR